MDKVGKDLLKHKFTGIFAQIRYGNEKTNGVDEK